MLRKIALWSAAIAFLAGCAPDIYDKAGGSQQEFSVDNAQCQMFAMGQPQIRAAQLPPTYTATTSYNGTYGNGMASGNAYTTVQAQQNPGQGFADLGAAIGNIAQQQQAMRVCMASRGYTLRAK